MLRVISLVDLLKSPTKRTEGVRRNLFLDFFAQALKCYPVFYVGMTGAHCANLLNILTRFYTFSYSNQKGAVLKDYDFKSIEKKWQNHWLTQKTFKTLDFIDKPKYYVLDMFPYPSGAGLHVGHPEGYTATDIVARYKRMSGFNVLHPMGWDAFGLPAEQYAVRTGTHPRVTTDQNINVFRKQIQSLGLSYDWDREIDTTKPNYYKHTQWIFSKLYERGLAYESHAPVNWCPALGSVLANEEVIDGKSEIGGHPVEKRPMRQWVLKITEYAERLLTDLEELDWPESVKQMQRAWIGRSEGLDIEFDIANFSETKLKVFTTRQDTIFGVTAMVLAPEHPLVKKIMSAEQKNEVEKYLATTLRKSERDRISTTEKTGCPIGAFALHPFTGEKLPILISDYVLASYGHGAVMAVPGHDQRDFDFAKKFNLKISRVIAGPNCKPSEALTESYLGDGKLVDSSFLNDMDVISAKAEVTKRLSSLGRGEAKVTFKLRDWLFSRQRYWGEPIPLFKNQAGEISLVDAKELPVTLPELDDFKPRDDGESPLARATDWLTVERNGEELTRETNTMPQWAGSCWYYLRFIDPDNTEEPFSKKKEAYWMPVDLYIGGVEHAVLHLLYARFWHKVLFDCGLVSTKEPFKKLVNQGMILGENGEKMSKSRGNVVNPDDVIAEWGADSMRLYEMFMGPLTATKPWQTRSISGVSRFLHRTWRLLVKEDSGDAAWTKEIPENSDYTKARHKLIKKVSEDLDHLSFNTAIAAMMEFVNSSYKQESLSRSSAEALILCLAPFAPHMSEELWQIYGHKKSLAYEAWPVFDNKLCQDDDYIYIVQVNGKKRAEIALAKDTTKEDALDKARMDENVAKYLAEGSLLKEIFVPGKIINFVVKQ